MKKLLKLLFVLSGSTTLSLVAVACGQESLDSILEVIRKGETKYNIDILSGKQIGPYQEKYQLKIKETEDLAKAIASDILNKANNETKINWADENLEPNTKAYSFKIGNGKKEENGYTWEVMKPTGIFQIKISYLVGKINDQKNFEASQKIDMTFDIKCCTTESDKIINEWITNFNQKIEQNQWHSDKPLKIDLTEKEIKLPKEQSSWSDLEGKIQEEVNNTLSNELGTTRVSWEVASKEKVNQEKLLLIYLSANYGNTKKDSKEFYIKFI